MRKKAFLSIDIDYFNTSPDDFRAFLRWFDSTITLPVKVVTSHHQMLLSVNKSNADVLINIDEHSDLADNKVTFLNCGTWVSYVKWRKQGRYIWIRPEAHYDGECNGGFDLFAPKAKAKSDWGQYKSHHVATHRITEPRKLWDEVEVTEVCFCISPNYSSEDIQKIFKQWMAIRNLKAKEGSQASDFYERQGSPKEHFLSSKG